MPVGFKFIGEKIKTWVRCRKVSRIQSFRFPVRNKRSSPSGNLFLFPSQSPLDSVFIVAFLAALIARKRFMTALFAVFGGVLYMIVDYGIFHLALHTRSIENGDLFWVLLWMSMSYGITNFALIWIWLGKDEHYKEYTSWLSASCLLRDFTEK